MATERSGLTPSARDSSKTGSELIKLTRRIKGKTGSVRKASAGLLISVANRLVRGFDDVVGGSAFDDVPPTHKTF